MQFYEQDLMLPVMMRREWFVEFRLSGGSALSVADERRASIPSSGGAGLTISLKVPDAEALRDELMDKGLEPEPIRRIWGSRAFYLRDPEGNRLEFWS